MFGYCHLWGSMFFIHYCVYFFFFLWSGVSWNEVKMSCIPTLSATFLLPMIMLSLRPPSPRGHGNSFPTSLSSSDPSGLSVPYRQINLSKILLTSCHCSAYETVGLLSTSWRISSMFSWVLCFYALGPRCPSFSLHSPVSTCVPLWSSSLYVLPPPYSLPGVLHSASLAPPIQPIVKVSLQPCRFLWPCLPSSAISPPYFCRPYYPETFSNLVTIEQIQDEFIPYGSRTWLYHSTYLLPFSRIDDASYSVRNNLRDRFESDILTVDIVNCPSNVSLLPYWWDLYFNRAHINVPSRGGLILNISKSGHTLLSFHHSQEWLRDTVLLSTLDIFEKCFVSP